MSGKPRSSTSKRTSAIINGVLWCIQFKRRMPSGLKGIADREHRLIQCQDRQGPLERLTTLIHEVRHAQDWDRDEEAVEREARELAQILLDLGYCHCPHSPL